MQYHVVQYSTMQHYGLPCSTLQYRTVSGNSVYQQDNIIVPLQYCEVICSNMQQHAVPSSTVYVVPYSSIQLYVGAYSTVQQHLVVCRCIQYCVVACNSMQSHEEACGVMQCYVVTDNAGLYSTIQYIMYQKYHVVQTLNKIFKFFKTNH